MIKKLRGYILFGLFVLMIFEVVVIAPKKLGQRHVTETEMNKIKTEHALKHGKSAPAQQNFSDIGPKDVDQTMKGVHLVEASGGVKEWELQSQMAQGYKDGLWRLLGVDVNLFGKTASHYNVVGDRGLVNTTTKDMEVLGNVVTKNSEGYTFKSPSMKYNSQKKMLTTPGDVEMLGPKTNGEFFEFYGKGFEADMNTNIMKIAEDVRAVKTILAEKRVMNIKSKSCQVHGQSNEAHFLDDVHVDIGTIRMTGDRADFIYDQETKALKSMFMQGAVKITDQGRWATADRVKVLFATNEFVLLGSPRVVQDESELRGEEIRLLDGGKTVKVMRAKARLDSDQAEKFQ